MNLLFKPCEIRKHIVETKVNTYFESTKETKTASFFEITLTHIGTDISVNASGYNKLDVMSNCLYILNNHVIAKQFAEDIPQDNIVYETKESNTVFK